MKVLCQDPGLNTSVYLEVAEDATIRDLAKILTERLELDSPPAFYAYLRSDAVQQYKNIAVVEDDRVDLPDDTPVRELLRDLRHKSLPIYFSTLSVDDAKLYQLRTHRFRQIGYDIDRLRNSSILIGGAGLLGGEIALNLATVGVGSVCIIDNGYVDWLNLYRQPLYDRDLVYLPKIEAAEKQLRSMGGIRIRTSRMSVPSWRNELDKHSFIRVLSELDVATTNADLVIGTFDSFSARAVMQFVALLQSRPFLVAALEASLGQVNVFQPDGSTGCYCCGLPDPRYGTWHDGGACTLASLDAQKITAAMASKCAIDVLTRGETDFDEVRYDARLMDFSKSRRTSSRRCFLCGPDGAMSEASSASWIDVLGRRLFSESA
jgi:molybdopterin/thiamine biosynthesis adenylyltransferase